MSLARDTKKKQYICKFLTVFSTKLRFESKQKKSISEPQKEIFKN